MSRIRKLSVHPPRSQRGAVLVISILLLLVLTIVGVAAMQLTRMQERMAGNTRDLNLAFQGAEAALRDGETMIRAFPLRPDPCTAAPCNVWLRNFLGNFADESDAWWQNNAQEYEPDGSRAAVTKDIAELAADPRFVVEEIGFVPDSLTIGNGPPPGRDFYQVTARSRGASGEANTVLQTTFTRRF